MNTLEDTEHLGTLDEAAELLGLVMGGPRWADSKYLDWQYNDNPSGRAYIGNRREDDVLAAHQTVIPQLWRSADRDHILAMSINSATRPGVRGKGYYSTMFKEVVARATAQGASGSYGVANANSTPIVVKRVGFRRVGQLPVKVAPATPFRPWAWEHHPVDAAFLSSRTFDELVAEVDRQPRWGLRVRWTPDHLRWRLASPGAAYVVHASPEVVAVSTRQDFGGLPVAIVLKLLARRPTSVRLDGQAALSAACWHHRAPVALHAGFNADVAVRGMAPPRRLLPAPLNLMYLSTTDHLRPTDFRADVFEFLDFDAY